MTARTVSLEGVTMPIEAAEVAESVGCSPSADLYCVNDGKTFSELLSDCLLGSDEFTRDAWTEYAHAIWNARNREEM